MSHIETIFRKVWEWKLEVGHGVLLGGEVNVDV